MSATRDTQIDVDADGKATVTIEGVTAEIVTDDEAEQASCVVCIGPSELSRRLFPDNIETTCARCGTAIVHRPHAPKKPLKICMRCATALANERDNVVVATSMRTVQEVERYKP